MFNKTAPVIETPIEAVPADLIPLSVLELDLAAPPTGGWPAHLAARGIAIVVDDLGRLAISRSDARRLLSEQREHESRVREMAAEQEQRFIESDQQWRAQLNPGVPWYAIPDGVSPATAMLAADRDAQPKRMTPLQEALAGESLTYHSYQTSPSTDDES